MALTKREEYIANWLQRQGTTTLRRAKQGGISEAGLDAVVAAGRAERFEEPEVGYKSTASWVTPSEAPATKSESEAPGVVSVEAFQALSPAQQSAVRWLGGRGKCYLREALQRGINKDVLDELTTNGWMVREDGPDPIYHTSGHTRHFAGQHRDPRSSSLPQVPSEPRTLTANEEYVARWLDRVGEASPVLAEKQQGISRETLDALVTKGRAVLVGDLYKSTAITPGDPAAQPPAVAPLLPEVVIPQELGPLTAPQKYAIRWIIRRGQCTLRQALQQGIEQEVLEALVTGGHLERLEGPSVSYQVTGQLRHFAGRERDPRSTRLVQPVDPEAKQELSAQEEYVARWLDRVGQVKLQHATRSGVEQRILDALVALGRAERTEGYDPVYKSTAHRGVTPSTMPAPVPPQPTPTPVASVSPGRAQLTRRQEYVARWLRRAREVSLKTAQQRGIDQDVLDLLVTVGLATREEGNDPIYRSVDAAVRMRKGVEAIPQPAIKPLPTPIDQELVDLLSDGQARTQAEVASALVNSNDFVAMSRLAREVQRALPELVSRGYLHRISFGIPVSAGNRRTWRYEERYVTANSVVPVCASCFRNYWSEDIAPPQTTGEQTRLCSFPECRRRTNDAAYVPKTEFEERLKVTAT